MDPTRGFAIPSTQAFWPSRWVLFCCIRSSRRCCSRFSLWGVYCSSFRGRKSFSSSSMGKIIGSIWRRSAGGSYPGYFRKKIKDEVLNFIFSCDGMRNRFFYSSEAICARAQAESVTGVYVAKNHRCADCVGIWEKDYSRIVFRSWTSIAPRYISVNCGWFNRSWALPS